MIRKEFLKELADRDQSSAFEIFREIMKGYSIEGECCPFCKQKGYCTKHAWYFRNLIDYTEGAVRYQKIRVLRVKCQKCKHTHSVLTTGLIPYTTYSFFFIIEVLYFKMSHTYTVQEICERYSVSASMLYRWMKLYGRHMGDGRKGKQSLMESLQILFSKGYSCFQMISEFFHKNQFSLLQGHKEAYVT